MRLENFIALRYLKAKKRLTFITIISYLSIGGISVGVGALIIVLSVFNGLTSLVKSFLVGFDPHIRIEITENTTPENFAAADSLLLTIAGIEGISPFVSGKVMLLNNEKPRAVLLKGIEPEKSREVYGIERAITSGEYSFTADDALPGIILGTTLADRLSVICGDTVSVVSPSGIEDVLTQFSEPKTQAFIVRGIFRANNNEYDAEYAYAALDEAKYLLGYSDMAQGYEMRLSDVEQAVYLKEQLAALLPSGAFTLLSWYDLHEELYSMMEIERWVAYILLSLIIVVAVFNILVSLTMTVIEKKRDIGVLKTMGLDGSRILGIFLREGLFIGLIGTIAGFAISLLFYYLHTEFNLYPLNPLQYRVDRMPMLLSIWDFLTVGGASFILSLLAAILPARRAAMLNPIEAIRWE